MMNGYAKTESNVVYLEDKDHTCWYKFFTMPVYRSNIDRTIVGYQCCIGYSQRYSHGSSYSTEHVSKERGNKIYMELLGKDLVKVAEPSFA